MRVRCLLAACLAWTICTGLPANAETWPDKVIKLIVPLPAGSAADTVARLVSQELSSELHQNVIVIDRPGASGEIGTTELAHSAPDGYTLGIATTTTMVTAPLLTPHLQYNPVEDLTPVAMIGYSPFVLVVNPKFPAQNLSEFIAFAKKKPGQVSYSSVGEGSLAHLAASLLSAMAGIQLNEIPYKSSTLAVEDLLTGRIDSQFGILTTTYQYITAGKLRALGITSLNRVPGFQDLPTIAESGLPGYETSLWLGLIAPAHTPAPIIARINSIINNMLASERAQRFLVNQAIFPEPLSPEAMADLVKNEMAKWKKITAKEKLE